MNRIFKSTKATPLSKVDKHQQASDNAFFIFSNIVSELEEADANIQSDIDEQNKLIDDMIAERNQLNAIKAKNKALSDKVKKYLI